MVRPIGEALGANRGITLPGQSIYEASETLKGKIGTILHLGERAFVYAQAGAVALAAGKMVQSSAPVPNHLNITPAVTAVYSQEVTVTLGATEATKNQYRNGWFHVNGDAGEGQCYRIKSNPAADSGATCLITLYDSIAVALTAASDVTLTANAYKGVIIVPHAALTAPARGVPLVAITEAYYGWLQVAGPAPVLTQGTVVIGQKVGLGGTADGACGPVAADVTDVWGTVMQVNASTEYSLIDLTLLRR